MIGRLWGFIWANRNLAGSMALVAIDGPYEYQTQGIIFTQQTCHVCSSSSTLRLFFDRRTDVDATLTLSRGTRKVPTSQLTPAKAPFSDGTFDNCLSCLFVYGY